MNWLIKTVKLQYYRYRLNHAGTGESYAEWALKYNGLRNKV